ncbi:MAG TPA: hypothetical protein VGR14_17910 [Verrucomicrobiae bacterium]|nr:hypothetical protein [Verrucomicrobiae bacterium]
MPHHNLVLTEKRAFFGVFWQLNRCFGKYKSTLLLSFGDFSGFFVMQDVAEQSLTAIPALQKKSYQKAYGRFFGFQELA